MFPQTLFFSKILYIDDKIQRLVKMGMTMTDPFYEVQQQINQLLPIVLVGPALLFTAAGLFIWLGGIRWLKIVAALTAAVAGMLCAWHFTDRQIVPVVLFTIIPVGLSFFLHKPIVVLLAGLLTAAAVIFFPVGISALQKIESPKQHQPRQQETAVTPLNLLDSISKAEEYAAAAKGWVVEYVRSVPAGKKSLALMAALGMVSAGLFSWRLVCGAACSLLGTVLISAGMLLLLLYKGADPLGILKENYRIIGWILLAMILGGTLLQYWLSPKKKQKKDSDKVHSDGGHK